MRKLRCRTIQHDQIPCPILSGHCHQKSNCFAELQMYDSIRERFNSKLNCCFCWRVCVLTSWGIMEVYSKIINSRLHYCDVIMDVRASLITSRAIVYSTGYSGADQRKHQSSASLAFVRGVHRSPVNSPHNEPVTRKMFPSDDVIMALWFLNYFIVTVRSVIPRKLSEFVQWRSVCKIIFPTSLHMTSLLTLSHTECNTHVPLVVTDPIRQDSPHH